ncbi:MAG TPA: sigma-70 family RNA polymerase sigma factor [Alphaproteobacteria bacterium]|nr:sigma-70 family RNA polymerase sigma factor [Alphaproteobacteria bacterium]
MFHGPELIEQLPYLRRMARALTKNRADADDLAQNCLERAIVYQHQFETGTNLRGWLLKIMHNLFIDSMRRAKRSRENSDTAQTYLSGHYTPSNQEHAIEIAELQEAMAQLPPEQYTTLVLITLEDMSYEEAARITNVPIGTIRSRLSRARASIALHLKGKCEGDRLPHVKLRRRPRQQRPDGIAPPADYHIGK